MSEEFPRVHGKFVEQREGPFRLRGRDQRPVRGVELLVAVPPETGVEDGRTVAAADVRVTGINTAEVGEE